MLTPPQLKSQFAGTHRLRLPEETWARVSPLLDRMGITRVADITWLDDIGIPTFQAVRPMSKSLCVSQGKGVTAMMARVSAVMECIELWHAEDPPLAQVTGTAGQADLGYDLYRLNGPRPSMLHDEMRLRWVPAEFAASGRDTLLPYDFVDMSSELRPTWCPPTFSASSNGLSCGNSYEEALLHGLYEVLERERVAVAAAEPDAYATTLDRATLPAAIVALLDRFAAAGATVLLTDITGDGGVPCFRAQVWSETYPIWMHGSGCHLDPEVAMSRALTECAQSRITGIAGSRDDLKTRVYDLLRTNFFGPGTARSFATVPYRDERPRVLASLDLVTDLAALVAHVESQWRVPVVVTDLRRPEIGIDVVKVVCPGLRHGDL